MTSRSKTIALITASIIVLVTFVVLKNPWETRFSLVEEQASAEPLVSVDTDQNRREPGFIVGRVLSQSGEVLASAKVCAVLQGGLKVGDARCVKVNNTGDYELTLLPGDYNIIASANRYRNESEFVAIAEAALVTRNFSLTVAQPTIGGVVKSASGELLPEAEVVLFSDGKLFTTLQTDQRGEFIGWAPPGPIQLMAAASGYGVGRVRSVAPSLDVEIILFPGFVVEGSLINRDNQPLADVRVLAIKNPGSPPASADFTTVTDQQGQFKLTGLPAGQHFITVRDEVWTLDHPEVAIVDINRQIQTVLLVAEKGASLIGQLTVVDNDQPCPRGSVVMFKSTPDNNNFQYSQTANVEQDGQVVFPAAPYGNYQLYPVCVEHQLQSGPNSINLNASKTTAVEWTFNTGLELEVFVKDSANIPVLEAVLQLRPKNTNPELDRSQVHSAVTDQDGHYKFGALEAGTYILQAKLPGINAAAPIETEVDVYATDELTPVELIFEAGSRIRIQATAQNGQAISQLFFHALDESGSRYEGYFVGDGEYHLGPMPAGQYKVFAYDNKNPKIPIRHNGSEWITLTQGEQLVLNFEYQKPGGLINGRISNHLGEGIANAGVRIVSGELNEEDEFYSVIQEMLHGDQSSITDSVGRFSIAGLDPNSTYRLFVNTPNGVKKEQTNLQVGEFVDIVIPPSVSLRGSVVDSNQQALSNFVVEITDVENPDNSTMEVIENSQGMFAIDNVLPGNKLITVVNMATGERLQQTHNLQSSSEFLTFTFFEK